MADSVTDKKQQDPGIGPREVMDFLRDNPSFLQQNPGAIDLLAPPREGGKDVADFRSYMIERLKKDKEEAARTARALVETGRANMNNAQRVHAAVLRLLEVESAKMGAHVATCPPSVIRQLYNHPLTDKGLAAFVEDWKKTGQSIL